MSAEQRLRMRRFEVVCQRAIARLQGEPEPSVEQALQARVLPMPVMTWRTVAADTVVGFGRAFVRVFQAHRLLRVWWKRRIR
jgi:hypothetical protein